MPSLSDMAGAVIGWRAVGKGIVWRQRQTARVDVQQLGQDRHPLSDDGGPKGNTGRSGGGGGGDRVGAAARGGEIAACGSVGCSGLSTRQVRTPFSSLQIGQMWPLGHGFPSWACTTTQKTEAMIPTTVRRTITIHSALAPTPLSRRAR
jgi:hypothetical protein